jgi:hypothetical protein
MKHLLISTLACAALIMGCSDDAGLNSTVTQSEQNEESAVVIGQALSLDSGGSFEAIELALNSDVGGGSFEGVPEGEISKAYESDDALFDSSSCTWAFTWHREFEGPYAGFTWDVQRTVHLMDEMGDCIVRPPGDGSVKAVDFTRIFEGSSYSPRHEGARAGHGDWAIRELHDDILGALVNGEHHSEGAAEVQRRTPDGFVTVNHEYTLDLEGFDLRVVRLHNRRIPIDGSIHVVYHAVRGNVVIDRDVWIYFGENGGRMEFENGDTYDFDPLSGEVL